MKPYFADQFDPRWGVEFYHGCGHGPFGHQPYYQNGGMPQMEFTGGAKWVSSKCGWSYQATTLDSADSFSCLGSSVLYEPNLIAGMFVVCFWPMMDANAASSRREFFHYGAQTPGASGDSFAIHISAAGSLLAGWSHAFANGRVSVATDDGGSPAVPLWTAHSDWVMLFLGYTPRSQYFYVNSTSVGANSTLPASGSGLSNSFVGIGGNAVQGGCTDKIAYVLQCKPLTFREKVYARNNKMTWMWAPGIDATAMTADPTVIPSSSKTIVPRFRAYG